MKNFKLLLLLFAFTFLANNSNAQYALAPGHFQINAGVGLSNYGFPIYGGFDVGVHKDISVGGEFSIRWYNPVGFSSTLMGFSGNGNYHFNSLLKIDPKFDFYAGLNIGYYLWGSSVGKAFGTSTLGIGAQIGGRYYFSKAIGAQLEFGGGNAAAGAKLGLSFKF